MAKMSKDAHEVLMKEIADGNIETTELLDKLQMLRDDFDESHVEPEGEGTTEEKEGTGETKTEGAGAVNYEEKFNELKNKYIERFFSNPREVKDEQRKNVVKDSENTTFEQLFKEKEG